MNRSFIRASVKLMALGGVSALAFAMTAPVASAENLVDALSAAYQSNPDLQAQRAQHGSAEHRKNHDPCRRNKRGHGKKQS